MCLCVVLLCCSFVRLLVFVCAFVVVFVVFCCRGCRGVALIGCFFDLCCFVLRCVLNLWCLVCLVCLC